MPRRVLVLIATLVAGMPAEASALCGQPISSGATPTASDALFVLRAAVGSETCAACLCDVDSSGGQSPVSASDALRVLRRAVGQPIDLLCPDCAPVECEQSAAPVCGGACTTGRTCALNPLDSNACVCLNDCEASQSSACGGSCDFALPVELACTHATMDQGHGPIDVCLCLPPDFALCVDSSAPDCSGACQPGALCTSGGGGGCMCASQPSQGTCQNAVAPACGGTCGTGSICQPVGDGCDCVDADGVHETCGGAETPQCAGACASGRSCSAESLSGCSCFDPCSVSESPACNGDCTNPAKVCMHVSASIGGSTLELCECRSRQ